MKKLCESQHTLCVGCSLMEHAALQRLRGVSWDGHDVLLEYPVYPHSFWVQSDGTED